MTSDSICILVHDIFASRTEAPNVGLAIGDGDVAPVDIKSMLLLI